MTPLGREIAQAIAQDGPIGIDRYLALCLGHPVHGYYVTRDPFGAAGDFVTAPEISQMFGELLGLWAAEVWRMMGAPARVRLVELGPGRGTLMADALRAARAAPGFREATEVVLVETSPVLRAVQQKTLAGADISWTATVEEALGDPSPCEGEGSRASAGSGGIPSVRSSASKSPPDLGFAEGALPTPSARGGILNAADPSPRKGEGGPASAGSGGVGSGRSSALDSPPDFGLAEGALPTPSARGGTLPPVIVIANEFFDALPVRQFVRTGAGWRERLVGLGADGRLAFGLAAEPPAGLALPERPEGFVLEVSAEGMAIAGLIARHVASQGGAALAIDYGEAASAGDTLQAVRAHGFVDPLAEPGEADLTTQVDFGALSAAASRAGAATMRLLPQADLLEHLGLASRAAQLRQRATADQAAAIEAAAGRLCDRSERGMGALFKALAFAHPALGALPAFEPDSPPKTP
jgi:NADH dehydrogenase [ubiquinone] 1 alpha subcomplex assembly factor 7